MKILVTGSEGYIGRRFVELLAERHKLIGCDLESPHAGGLAYYYNFRFQDLEPSHLEGLDAILHLAAVADDRTAEMNPLHCFETNWFGTIKLAEAAKKAGVKRFVFASSASIYARRLGEDTGPLDELAYVQPKRVYAVSKWLAERALSSIVEEPVILRQGTVYGLSSKMRLDNVVVHTMMRDAIFRGKVRLNDGRQYRPLIYIDDLVKVLEKALEEFAPGIYNVAEKNYTIEDVALCVSQSLGVTVETFKLGTPWSYRMDCQKLFKQIEPEVNLAQGVFRMSQKIKERLMR